jgi:TRAP-type C4-dicarboxylate transport system substrate-binding protein
VGFKIYGGGVLGDEKDVLRKIRIGQLHAAGFTGVGMGEIAPEVRILDTPFLFQNHEEIDLIYKKFDDYFSDCFTEGGYEFLGWAEVGFIYVFSKKRFRTLEELRNIKMWVWQDDVVALESFKAFGLRSIPLSIINVMTALQTNMVEGVYSTPLASIALQWFTQVDYMMGAPIASSAGAVLISQKMFQKLPNDYQMILKQETKKHLAELTHVTRQQSIDALDTLKNHGIEIIEAPDITDLKTYYELGASARKNLIGKYYSQEILDRIESVLETHRKKSGKNN